MILINLKGKKMDCIKIHNMLIDDLAYQYSLENNDLHNLRMVLRAYQLPFDYEEATAQLHVGMDLFYRKQAKMHLTHTGYSAGSTYCGAPRGNDEGAHLSCAYQRSVPDPIEWINKHITCADCRAVYMASFDDEV